VSRGWQIQHASDQNDLAGLAFVKTKSTTSVSASGDCSFKIGDPGLKHLQSSINWKRRTMSAKPTRPFADVLEYLLSYQAKGNRRLAAYHDSEKISRVQDGLTKTVANLPSCSSMCRKWLLTWCDFRRASRRPPRSSILAGRGFGLKPVHRVTHVLSRRRRRSMGRIPDRQQNAVRQPYFRSALELRFLIPTEGSDKKPGPTWWCFSAPMWMA